MKEMFKNKKIFYGILLGILFIISISVTYAWFGLTVSGNEEAKQIKVETGTLSLVYKDGVEIKGINVHPGWNQTKTFTVTNTGTFDTSYNIIFKDLVNQIERDELVVSYTCTSYTGYVDSSNKGTVSGTCNSLTEQVVPLSEGALSSIITENISIGLGITHEYTLTLLFKETNDNQNYNQGKDVNTVINITRYIESYDLTAQLLDSNSNPIANANVEIDSNPKYAITDEDGKFTVEDLEVGTHEIIVKDSSNNLLFSDSIKINAGDSTNIQDKSVTVNKNVDKIGLKIYKSNSNTIQEIKLLDWYEECTSTSNNLNCKMITVASALPSSDENVNFAYTSDGYSVDSESNDITDESQITNGLYYTSDLSLTEDYDGDTVGDRVYYYRGAVTNNNVIFGGFCWRIVRTNEDGSVKLRYNGEYANGTCPVTGTAVKINNESYQFNAENNDPKHNEYVFVDGSGESTIKGVVEDWYEDSGLIDYEDKIANVPYCADKSNPIADSNRFIFYGLYNRFYDTLTGEIKSNPKPVYKCLDESGKHTASGDTWGGNGKLSYPIGLLTADEVAYAGGAPSGLWNDSFYLYTSENYWLISPAFWHTGVRVANLFYVYWSGEISLDLAGTGGDPGLLPAVSLRPEVTVSSTGDGSYTNPYVVVTE